MENITVSILSQSANMSRVFSLEMWGIHSVRICFSSCRQKRTTFLIPASMRCLCRLCMTHTSVMCRDYCMIIFYASFYLFQSLRCSGVLVRFHLSFCPSSVATGSRAPIISLQSRHNLISLLVRPPISKWRQTAQLKYTGSISWGRWEEIIMRGNNMVQWLMPLKYSQHSV